MDDEIESIIYMCREVSVYKIPPLKQNEGHRAQDWGDLAAPLWKGRLRIVEQSSQVLLKFEDPNTGDLFANAPYDPQKPSVEAVLDSSRYFVIRVEDAGRKAFIGMGFVERTDSFDFNVALQDYTKRWRVAQNPPSPTQDESLLPAGPKKDYSLKEGQTFSINIPGRPKSSASNSSSGSDLLGGSTSTSSTSSSGLLPLLPPPPSATRRR